MADSKFYDEIDRVINTGKYNAERVEGGGMFNKCNLFTGDVLKKYWGVDLPRRKELAEGSRYGRVASSAEGGGDTAPLDSWPENPISASMLDMYFRTLDTIPDSGVYQVDPKQGSRLAADGLPVVVLGGSHATISAPGDEPAVFRSDLNDRSVGGQVDRRTRVGVKPRPNARFFYIDPEKYKEYRKYISDNKISVDDVIEGYYVRDKRDKLIRKKK